MASGPITSWQTEGGKVEAMTDFIFLGFRITATVTATMKLKDACSMRKKVMTDLDSILKSRDHFTDKDPSSQSYGFSSSHVWM